MAERWPIDERLLLLRRHLAEGIAEDDRLYRRLEQERQRHRQWERRAGLALRKGLDNLSRQASERAGRCRSLAEAYQSQYDQQRLHVARLQRSLQSLDQRYSLAGKRRRTAPCIDLALFELESDPVADRLAKLEREGLLDIQRAELKARLADMPEAQA